MSRIDTFRVAVTDRCNLRCIYCMPPEGVAVLPHDEVLRFEEIERVVRAAVRAGAAKVRLTGGEPLVRRGIIELVERLARVPGVMDLPMTTNGALLEGMAPDLKRAGLHRVTVSLDTLRPERFLRIAGRPWIERARRGIEAAAQAGLHPVKINVVPVPGENDDEFLDFAALARELDLEVRFIERMPIRSESSNPGCGLSASEHVPAARIKRILEAELGELAPAPDADPSRPARVYRLPGGRGRIGFIAAMSEPFCRWCGRMRLTPDGKLRVCLVREIEVDVKGPLRSGVSDDELFALYQKAVDLKPRQEAACFQPTNRIMSQIGG